MREITLEKTPGAFTHRPARRDLGHLKAEGFFNEKRAADSVSGLSHPVRRIALHRKRRAPPQAPEPPPLAEAAGWTPNVTLGTLQNGVRYIVRENKRPENRAELRLVVT